MKIGSLSGACDGLRRFSLGVVLLALLAPLPARAELMLYPTRVVIDGSKRSAQVEIVNRGLEPETYRISIVNRRMTESGEITPVSSPEPGELFADGMVRYTPRQVTLQPGASQAIRISVRKPTDLAPGEYRSHLQFDRVADISAASDLESAAKAADPNQVSIVLPVLIGAAIPVIVRHGRTEASVRLDSLQLEPAAPGSSPELSFVFRREGNRSVYGDLIATYTASGGKPVEIGKASGIAVYAPNALRRSRLPLTLKEGMTLRGGTIQLQYRERPEAGGALIAEGALTMP